MQKIFQEYGGVIATAMAIVALVSLIGLFFTSDGDGWMDNAFHDVVDGFVDKVDEAVPGGGGNSAPVAGLYNANDELVASWDELVNTYGMDVTTDYTSSTYETVASSPYNVLKKSALSSGVKLVIHNGVTCIGDWAFYKCTNLTSVTIPDSVDSFGNYVFRECTNLTCVTFGENSRLTSIGHGAFLNCENLVSVNIPDDVTSLLTQVFDDCTNLTSVNIPGSVTGIGDSAFWNCTSLTSITFEGTVAEWNAITKASGSSGWNYNCGEITVTCTDGTVTVPAW